MEKVLLTILDAGSQYELPAYLQNRVRPTNLICLLVIFSLAIPFVIISLLYFPKMAIFPAGGGIVAALVIGINYLGGIYYSRLVLPVLLLVLSSLYNAYFSTSIADSISGVYLAELSFTLIPFVLFDFSEKKFLVICAAFSFLILVVFPHSWHYFDMGYTGKELREGPLSVLTVALALVFQLSCITGLSYLNQLAENRSQRLLGQMQEKNDHIQRTRTELEGNLAQLEQARQQENNRQWIAAGLANLSNLIRQRNTDDHFYDQILSAVIKYIGANQGGLYLVTQPTGAESVQIDLKACYAYDRKKYREQSLAPGQGLLGQTYLEGEYIYLTNLPPAYTTITSGLGEATPTVLLLVPLKVNDQTEGLLELASFNKLLPHQIEFVLQSAESLGAAIRSNRITTQTQRLLHQAQEQTEIHRAQEEEMRQNLEELEATQEEMRRKNEAMEQLIAQSAEREQLLRDRQHLDQQRTAELEDLKRKLDEKEARLQALNEKLPLQ